MSVAAATLRLLTRTSFSTTESERTEALSAVVDLACEALGCTGAVLLRADSAQAELVTVASRGVPIRGPLIGETLEGNQGQLFNMAPYDEAGALLLKGLPDETGPERQEQLDLVLHLAAKALRAVRIATERETTDAESQQRSQLLADLNQLSVAISGNISAAAVAQYAVDHLRRFVSASAVSLFLWDKSAMALRLNQNWGVGVREPADGLLRRPNGLASQAYSEGKAVMVRDYANWPDAVPGFVAEGIAAAAAVPLIASGRAIGVFVVRFEEQEEHLARREDALLLFAAQLAPVLDAAIAREELQQREARYRGLLEGAADGIGIMDEERRYVEVSDRLCEMLGYTRAEMLTLSTPDVVEPTELVNRPLRAAALAEGRVTRFERQLLRKDGSTLTAEISSVRLPDGSLQSIYRDVTQRKIDDHTRSALAAIVESTQDAVIGSDLDRIVTSWNKGAERMYGYTAEEALGRRADFIVAPEARDGLGQLLAATLTGERFTHVDAPRIRKDGTRLSVSVSVTPLRDSSGAPVGYATIARDVTEALRTEEALRASEARFRQVWETARDAMGLTDTEGRVLAVNPAYCDLYGYAESEIVGQGFEKIYPVDQRERFAARYRAMMAGPDAPRNLRVEVERADGTRRIVESRADFVMHDGQRTALLSIIRDVTEQARAEQAVKESEDRLKVSEEQLTEALHATVSSEQRYRALFEQNPDAILVYSPEGILLAVNDAGLTLSGYTREEIVGQTATRYVDPEEAASTGAAFAAAAAGELQSKETLCVHKAGHRVPVSVTYVPIIIGGVVEGVYALAKDLTDLHAAEKHRELLARSEKVRALGQMARGMAHDLNQQFALVSGYGELGQRALGATPADLAVAQDALRIVSQAAIDGGATVKGLLAFARGQGEGDMERVDLSCLIREIAELTAPRWRDLPQAEGRPISLLVEAEPKMYINGWNQPLRDAVINLVFNAVDAMPMGGTIHLRVARTDDHVRLTVSDTGTGMTAEVQQRLFEPFFTTKGDKGTGLGLAGVFGIVERHQGEIQVHSELGQGSTFRLIFPAWIQSDHSPDGGVLPAVIHTTGLRVMAVDDEALIARMLTRMLTGMKHQATSCASGEDALFRMEEARGEFDVLVTDLGLGAGMSGWDLVTQVRARWPHVRTVLATGWGATINPEQAQERGVDAVIAKPYRMEELRRSLQGE